MPSIKTLDCILTPKPSLWNISEKYFYLDGISEIFGHRKYTVIKKEGMQVYVSPLAKTKIGFKELLWTILKVISYASLIFPALLLVVKFNYHKSYIFKILENSSPLKQNVLAHENSSLKQNALALTGGLINGGGTCYIAAVLQCLKTSPYFWRHLNEAKPLTRRVNETPESYELRKKIRRELATILRDSKSGKTVSAPVMDQLRQSCAAYKPRYISSQGGGFVDNVWMVLRDVLEIPKLKVRNQIGDFETSLINVLREPVSLEDYLKDSELREPADILAINLYSCVPSKNLQISSCAGTKISYRLVGFTYGSGHFAACVQDKATKEWMEFDDHRVYPLPNFSPDQRRDISLAFYERV